MLLAVSVVNSLLVVGCDRNFDGEGRVAPAQVMAAQVKSLSRICNESRLNCKFSRHRAVGPYSEVVVGGASAWGASMRIAILVDKRGADVFANGNPDPPELDQRIGSELFGSAPGSVGGFEERGRQVVVMTTTGPDVGPDPHDEGCLGWLFVDGIWPGPPPRSRPECKNMR